MQAQFAGLKIAVSLATLLILNFPSLPVLGEETEPQEPETEDVEPKEEEETQDPPEPGEPGENTTIERINPGTSNPLNQPVMGELDKLIQTQINDDLWKSLYSPLPCIDTSFTCVSQLQTLAVTNNPVIKTANAKIEEINTRIDEAAVANRTSINLAVFEPAVQLLINNTNIGNPATQAEGTIPREGGLINNIASFFLAPTRSVNRLFEAIGLPLFRSFFGGGQEQRDANLAIADLRLKVAQMQQEKSLLEVRIRDQVQIKILDLDRSAKEFQIAQMLAQRSQLQQNLYTVSYRFGQSSTENYLQSLGSIDNKKAALLREWAAFRRELEGMKLLVLSQISEE